MTLDLPIDNPDLNNLKYDLEFADAILVQDKQRNKGQDRGFLFSKYAHYNSKIKRLFGDSATFDFTPYYNAFDVVFIDSSHRYENVLIDSENALKLLKNRKGIIIWDDYVIEKKGVVEAVHEFRLKYNFDIRRIKSSRFAYLQLL
jgi:hypothetical protein|tara:strand:- start:344 stop:778 length:435 start_codon:yes stop_codon:yes gene_type:complete